MDQDSLVLSKRDRDEHGFAGVLAPMNHRGQSVLSGFLLYFVCLWIATEKASNLAIS